MPKKLVKSILNPEAKPAKADSHEVAALSQKLSDALGATVKLKQSKSGKAVLRFSFMAMMSLISCYRSLMFRCNGGKMTIST
ncbi:Uncharacterised protein [Moraxella caviae]|nr:Uncharacterised protein [Moraxella caviae]